MSISVTTPFALPSDGYVQTVPLGDHPNKDAGIVQVVDRISVQAMNARFRDEASRPGFAGILVDNDHFSMDPSKPSIAAGWIVSTDARPDGLYSKIRWSDSGLRAVEGGDYRFLSPVFNYTDLQDLGGNRKRPLRLAGLGLTNQPAMRTLKPITNRNPQTLTAREAADAISAQTRAAMREHGISFREAWNFTCLAQPALVNRACGH